MPSSLNGLAHADLNDSPAPRTAPRDGEAPQPPSDQGPEQRFTFSSPSMSTGPNGDLTLELKETKTLPPLGGMAHADLSDSPAPRTAPRDGVASQPAIVGPGRVLEMGQK